MPHLGSGRQVHQRPRQASEQLCTNKHDARDIKKGSSMDPCGGKKAQGGGGGRRAGAGVEGEVGVACSGGCLHLTGFSSVAIV